MNQRAHILPHSGAAVKPSLQRAVEREPEAAEAFAVRADVHERLGQEQPAAIDRTCADYLRS